jgi:acyl-CoA thioesterase I
MNARFAIWTGLPLLIVGVLVYVFLIRPGSEAPSREGPITIVAFGDSLTEGDGVAPEDAYPAVLERVLKESGYDVRMTNAGISGDTTAQGMLRLPSVIDADPDIVLLGLGANDMLQKVPVEETRKNLVSMLDAFRNADISVVLLRVAASPTGGLGYAQAFNAMYVDLADQYRLPFVESLLKDVALRPALNGADGIHPNAAGYAVIVEENVLPVLVPVLREFAKGKG